MTIERPARANMLIRAALILRYKQPFVDWINAVLAIEDGLPTTHEILVVIVEPA